ncbi:MAG TPA: methyl-accepting chemotaxis protein [Nevskiaceae bacterium]|nr:methyl-accepting chemotaxis protein [Nevskiaceae bacterium]
MKSKTPGKSRAKTASSAAPAARKGSKPARAANLVHRPKVVTATLHPGQMTQQSRAELDGQIAAIHRSLAVIEFDLKGNILKANDNFLRAMGYMPDEVHGKHHSMFVDHAVRVSADYALFWDKLSRGEYDSGVYKRLGKHGREVWIQATYNPIFDASGRPFKVIKYATDITEAQLRKADYEGQLSAISKAQAVIEFDLKGNILNANENFLKVMGYTLKEVQGKHHSVFVDAAYRTSLEYLTFWDKLGQGEYDAGIYKRVAKGNREVWIQATYNPIYDANGKPFKVVKYATDITAAQLKKADYEGQLSAISKAQAVIEFDMGGNILNANQNFLDALGYTPEEVRGKHHAIFVSPAYRASKEYRSFWEKLGRGEYDSGIYPRQNKAGEVVWIQATYNPIFDMAGRPFKVVKYATDITQQRVAELNALRVKSGLDSVVTNVMIADADLNIVYVNKSIVEMLTTAEDDIRKDVPSFSASSVVGTNIDTFHKNPTYQRGLLKRMTSTHKAKLTLGGRTFSLILNPINDPAGTRLGYVVEWRDMTSELAAQAREAELLANVSRIKQGLDAVVTNVMIADADLNVVYVNHSIKEMLSIAEADIKKDVPSFNAKSVIGTNIDTFHKNPAYQRGLLAKMTHTHKASLTLGGRTFSLILNPINDDQARRLGYVVEWKDMTAELAAQKAEAERQAAERKLADENLRIKNALDNVSGNVMIANNEREIVYMNTAVGEMLTRAEGELRKALPHFDARKLMGASIDVFHKNPAHQTNLLSSLRGAYRTEIKVGSLTFGLIASPIVNAQGERLGTVVEWRNRTTEVAVEQEVGAIVSAAANGDFTQRVSLDGKEGFFKGLAESINQLMGVSSVGLNEVARVLGALAQGDLTQTVQGDFKGTFGKLKDDANQTVSQLTEIITQIKQATDTINTAAREISTGNSDLSARTEQQAASLEETASSMEELTSTVKQNAENAKQANQLAVGASDVARKGGSVVSEVVTTMSAINESSKKIVDIISVIDGIAFQTNILALNAAVEAARAGEQGRGFAVVAAEVRSLAQRSAGAAKEIKSLIGDSVEKVGNGAKLVDQAGKTMEEIVTSVKRVTDIMAEISAASQEQSQGIEQVNQTITQMDEVTQQNAALVEEASAAARSLEEQAGGLSQSVSQFKLDDSASPVLAAAPARTAARPAAVAKPAARAGAARPVAKPASSRAASRAATPPPADKGGEQWTEF